MNLSNKKTEDTSSQLAKCTLLSTLSISMMAVSYPAFAEDAKNTLTDLSTVQVSPDSTELRFTFTSQPTKPKIYALKSPSSLVLEFDSGSLLSQRAHEVNAGIVGKTRAVTNNGKTRVTVLLDGEAKTSTPKIEGKKLILTVKGQKTQSTTNKPQSLKATQASISKVKTNISSTLQKVPATLQKVPETLQKVPEALHSVSDVATRAVEDMKYAPAVLKDKALGLLPPPPQVEQKKMVVRVNPLLKPNINTSYMNSIQSSYSGLSSVNFFSDGVGGTVSVDLTSESVPIDVQRQGNSIVINMVGSSVPRHLLRRMNVNSGLVASIDAKNRGKNGIITINMKDEFEYQAYQSGNQLKVSVTAPEVPEELRLEEKVYSGEPLSMEFQDVEIRNVVDILGKFTQMNIVASDEVAGNITLRLVNVPWDQALDIILESKNLDKRVNGNVILIGPAQKFIEDEKKARELALEKKKAEPIRIENITLNYAKAKNVEELIRSSSEGSTRKFDDRTNGKQKEETTVSLLSSRGTVAVDERTNTLVVKDTSKSIANIRKLVKKIDVPVKQVMIEARIVSANDNFSKELGVNWGVLSDGAANNNTLLVGGSNKTVSELKNFDIQKTTIGGQEVAYPSYTITSPNNLNVDLGVGSPAGRVAFSLLSLSPMMLDLELSAMQADAKGEVISAPKVLTADKQKAKISSGTQIPFMTTSGEGTKTEFVEAALSLEVTPNITPTGKVGLDLNITNGSPVVFNGKTVIAEDAIKTNVLVDDGQTVVLGGVFKNTVSDGVTKVPFFGDLPYVGKMFRNNKRSNQKNELLIFITTRIINDGVSNF